MSEVLFFILGLIVGGLTVANIFQYHTIKYMEKEIKKG